MEKIIDIDLCQILEVVILEISVEVSFESALLTYFPVKGFDRSKTSVTMIFVVMFLDDGLSPLAPPRNKNRQETEENDDNSHLNSQSIQPASNGLPPTPKVHMGACFSKVSCRMY